MVKLHDGCQVYPGFTHRVLTFSDQVREVVTIYWVDPSRRFFEVAVHSMVQFRLPWQM